ncbi:MAG: hypothetical protein ABIE94_02200 [archaeon]
MASEQPNLERLEERIDATSTELAALVAEKETAIAKDISEEGYQDLYTEVLENARTAGRTLYENEGTRAEVQNKLRFKGDFRNDPECDSSIRVYLMKGPEEPGLYINIQGMPYGERTRTSEDDVQDKPRGWLDYKRTKFVHFDSFGTMENIPLPRSWQQAMKKSQEDIMQAVLAGYITAHLESVVGQEKWSEELETLTKFALKLREKSGLEHDTEIHKALEKALGEGPVEFAAYVHDHYTG